MTSLVPNDAGSRGCGPGHPHPLGSMCDERGVNFSLYSRHATHASLLLYDQVGDTEPARVFELDPALHRTWHYWHIHVPGLRPGQLYAWEMGGPRDPARGHLFDRDKLLLDPYARAVAVPPGYRRSDTVRAGRNDATAMKSVVVRDHQGYDWGGDTPLRRPFAQTVIYELHVRGFTRHPSSGVPAPQAGTYAGLVHKIPYLKSLGITAVELMPVFAFDAQDAPPGLSNHWGYAPVSFFAPHPAYAAARTPLGVLDEFRDMVKAMHRAGLEVILDVVFNHTAEGGDDGPCISLRGIDNATYYMLDDQGRALNYSGCGNTLNANNAVVRRMILDSLRYWVQVMHVDGFRFDLASILSRDERGQPMARPPVLWDIDSDPALAGTKLIAEAWDAAGLYQVGGFAGDHWKEWNGRFRDDVRSFVRGDPGQVGALADRLLGSPALYAASRREPAQSINFVTSHDGFTLADLVAYDRKHNEANGEANRDGSDDNRSWNCGVEGPTDDAAALALRERQVKNLLAINVLSLGTPMLLMGDEMGRSQQGNNNAYCQDNALSWLDWGLLPGHQGLVRFVRGLIALRNQRDSVREDWRLDLTALMTMARISLHGVRLGEPDFRHDSHSLAVTARSLSGDRLMHFALNGWWQPLDFQLPALPGWAASGWRRVVDTAQPSPLDMMALADAPRITGTHCTLAPRSVVALIASDAGPGSSPADELGRAKP